MLQIRRALLLLACLLGSLCIRASDTAALRSELRLSDGWTFHRGCVPGAESVSLDDHAWESVVLPHTWNASDGADGGTYYMGDGWYRRRLVVPESWSGRRLYLQFDGANRTAEVFVNGKSIGRHRGGFARFRFDVTDVLRPGTVNLLAVRVNNGTDDNVAPVSADFTFFGGIYRPVSLLAVDPVHIEMLDHASPGVFYRQASVTDAIAEVDFDGGIANDSPQAVDALVRCTVRNREGVVVHVSESRMLLNAGARERVRRHFVIPAPHLWSGASDPYLYSTRTEVLVGGEVRDQISLPLGLRYYSVNPASGFSLNGRPFALHGVNRHQEVSGKGWAISDADELQDFELIREVGATMVRESHYQQSQYWNDLADAKGMVMWAELAYVNEVRDNRVFFENCRQQLRELIRQNFHHPAILFWSIGNETFVRDAKTTPADANDRLLHMLADVVREEDPSRLSTYASNGNVTEPRAGATDVIAFNKYFGWYKDMPEDFAKWLDDQHSQRPDLSIGMSEYGAGANVEHHEYPARKPRPDGPWHPEEWQASFHESYWQTLQARPWLWTKLIWVMFDFASDGRNEGGTPGRNDKGLITGDRLTRKDAFYWYKANWNPEPMVHITSKRFNPRSQASSPVKVYSNLETVELFVNGVSQGVRHSDNHLFLWSEVCLGTGDNRVEALGFSSDHTAVRDTCNWTLRVDPK